MVRKERMEKEESRNEDHGPADGPASRLEYDDDQYTADDQIRRIFVAQA
jgi:hypothetical protein